MEKSTESSSASGPLQELNGLYIGGELPALDSLVRKTYFKYLKRTALQYAARAKIDVTDAEITKFAQQMELDALRTCMSRKVYRLNMLDKINDFKRMICICGPSAEKKLSERESTKRNYSGNELQDSNVELPRSLEKSVEIDIKPQPTVAKERNVSCTVRSPIVEEYIPNSPLPHEEIRPKFPYDINGDNDIYNTVYKQLSEMFQAEGGICGGKHKNVRDSSPSSIISSDRYFNHCDRNFWYLESEINKAQYNQNILNSFELNETSYRIVADKIREFFGNEGSPLFENSPRPLKKLSYTCKARITWHVKKSLNGYYLKNEFRSADEFRILAKAIVTRFIQIDPFMNYRKIYKSIEKAFSKKSGNIQNIEQIQRIVSQVSRYAS